ncbi:MAG: aminoglycoside 6-adenylyltransferase, partial [Ruminococcus flavefaciens]|nr:aminoglycoside 6-adenylyltransferase [Ruminococcus flavefaciens]
RGEMPYVQDMANYCVRPQLLAMLNWKVGILTEWSVSTGKSSKYLHRWLSGEEWNRFLSTYFDADVEHAWQSVLGMCELFESVAWFVGEKLGWEYNEAEGKAAYGFLKHVRQGD